MARRNFGFGQSVLGSVSGHPARYAANPVRHAKSPPMGWEFIMSRAQQIVQTVLQSPSLLGSLIESPEQFAQLLGLGPAEMNALGAVVRLAKGLRPAAGAMFGPQAGAAPNDVRSVALGAGGGGGWPGSFRPGSSDSTAIVGVISLAVVAGTLAALGAVSLVALARSEGGD